MNVHHLDDDPARNARLQPDVWLQSDLRELAQVLGTACHAAGIALDRPVCRPYNPHGRFVRWVLASSGNASWAVRYGAEVVAEYRRRRGVDHASARPLLTAGALLLLSGAAPQGPLTPWPEAFNGEHPAGATTSERYRSYLALRVAGGLRVRWTEPESGGRLRAGGPDGEEGGGGVLVRAPGDEREAPRAA